MVEIKVGDRVRVIHRESSYTGCRGTVAESSGPVENGQLPLGYLVAIDGENGVTRPFLAAELQQLKAVCTRNSAAVSRQNEG